MGAVSTSQVSRPGSGSPSHPVSWTGEGPCIMGSSERVSKPGGRESSIPWKPTVSEIAESRGKTVPDLIGPGLRVLFCGINPSLYSAAVGHHFARPGNRFWPTLHAAGLTDRRLGPFEERELLGLGYGITNVVDVATARADELSP